MIRRFCSILAVALALAGPGSGTEIVELTYSPCGDTPVFCFGEPRECDGLINNRGEILHRFKVSHRISGPFNEGLIASEFPGTERWGYLDTRGQWAIKPQFRRAWPFRGGLARVEEEGSWDEGFKDGFIDKSGKYVIPPQFEEATDFDGDGFARFWVGEWGSVERRMGVMDRSGEVVIEPDGQFFVGEFAAGHARAILTQEACWAVVNHDQLVLERYYFGVSINSLDELRNHDEFPACSWSLIDKRGKPINEDLFYAANSPIEKTTADTPVYKIPEEGGEDSYCHGLQQTLINDAHESGSTGPMETAFVDRKGKVVFAWKWHRDY